MSRDFDNELRAAIEPLRGDPVDAWADVLGHLPPAPRRPLVPLVAGAIAAGLAIGWVAAFLTRGPAATGQPPRNDQLVAQSQPVRVVGRVGKAFLETETGAHELQMGDGLAFAEILGTGDESRLLLALPGAIELRLNSGTRLMLESQRTATLVKGQLFIGKRSTDGGYVLVTNDVDVRIDKADVQITVRSDGTEVVALDGPVHVATMAGDEAALETLQMVRVSGGSLGAIESAGPRWKHVAWQVETLAACSDRLDEAYGYAYELVRALDDPTTEAEAEHALRSASALGAGALGMFAITVTDTSPELRKRCWILLSDVADSRSLKYLLNAIANEDVDVRIGAAHAIERITAIPSGEDDAFWRGASYADRFDVVDSWRKRLRDF